MKKKTIDFLEAIKKLTPEEVEELRKLWESEEKEGD